MGLKIVSQIGHFSIQGSPVFGLRKHGVPPGGPFDSVSSRLANSLLGNEDFDPVLELTAASVEIEANERLWLAVSGHGHDFESSGSKIPTGTRFCLERGKHLTVRPNRNGMRGYLAFPGGVAGVATELRAMVRREFDRVARLAEMPKLGTTDPVRYVPIGLEVGFDVTVSPICDRVGLRLDSSLDKFGSGNDKSRPSVIGAIQQSPDGGLLIHGPDGPTIGGYSMLGVVATVDIPRIAQMRPLESYRFKPISVATAKALLSESESGLDLQIRQIRALI